MTSKQNLTDVGLLILRVLPGMGLFFAHGWSKLGRMPGIFETFSDPIGLGPAVSAALVILAEAICAPLVALGLFTRWTSIPVLLFLLVAGLVHHAPDPFRKQEFALIYAVPYLVLLFTGGGRYALDTLIERRKRQSP